MSTIPGSTLAATEATLSFPPEALLFDFAAEGGSGIVVLDDCCDG